MDLMGESSNGAFAMVFLASAKTKEGAEDGVVGLVGVETCLVALITTPVDLVGVAVGVEVFVVVVVLEGVVVFVAAVGIFVLVDFVELVDVVLVLEAVLDSAGLAVVDFDVLTTLVVDLEVLEDAVGVLVVLAVFLSVLVGVSVFFVSTFLVVVDFDSTGVLGAEAGVTVLLKFTELLEDEDPPLSELPFSRDLPLFFASSSSNSFFEIIFFSRKIRLGEKIEYDCKKK